MTQSEHEGQMLGWELAHAREPKLSGRTRRVDIGTRHVPGEGTGGTKALRQA